MTSLREVRSYRRTLAEAMGAGALVGAQVVGWPVHGAGAQTSQDFVLGTANATAQALQLAEVEESRSRVVQAGYEERRRLERDLHDGAQQRLVTLGIVLRRL